MKEKISVMKEKISITIDSEILNRIQWDVKEHKAKSVSERVELLVRLGRCAEKVLENPPSRKD